MGESTRNIWLPLLIALFSGERPSFKIMTLYLIGTVLAFLTVLLALKEFVNSLIYHKGKNEGTEENNINRRSQRESGL